MSSIGCGTSSEGSVLCTYNFPFKAIKEGTTKILLHKINKNDNSIVEKRYVYVTIKSYIPEIKIVYLNNPFTLEEGGKAEVVDYKNMRITLDGVGSEAGNVNNKFTILVIELPTGATTRLVIDEYESKEVFGAVIKVLGIDLNTRTAKLLVTLEPTDFDLKVKTDRYTYSPGDIVKIYVTLSGDPSIDFSNVLLEIKVIGPREVIIPLEVSKIGTVASGCAQATTTGTYTCEITNMYSFVAKYPLSLDALSGIYRVEVRAKLGNREKSASTSFKVEKIYSDYVDVSIQPERQVTSIGKEVSYKVTVTDRHPAPVYETIGVTPTTGGSTEVVRIYNYIIDLDGLPYNSVYPRVVSVPAGGSETFELKIFPSPVRTAQGITTAVRKVEAVPTAIAPAEERTVSITGQPIAAEPSIGELETQPVAVNEALFRFTVKATLREDPTVSDSVTGFLHVRFIQTPQPPPFPEEETFNIELRRGWNLISLPGKGVGFTQGTCSAIQKPLAYVYLPEERRYVTLEEAVRIMGTEALLEYLSTHSFWIYSYEHCNIGFRVTSYSTYSGLPIVKGWNMLGITKDMVGETISNIKGTCTFEKVYTWDADSQKWVEKTENDLIEKMGYGILVKATTACSLQTNVIQPPALPEG